MKYPSTCNDNEGILPGGLLLRACKGLLPSSRAGRELTPHTRPGIRIEVKAKAGGGGTYVPDDLTGTQGAACLVVPASGTRGQSDGLAASQDPTDLRVSRREWSVR